jgi:hypothetical protein
MLFDNRSLLFAARGSVPFACALFAYLIFSCSPCNAADILQILGATHVLGFEGSDLAGSMEKGMLLSQKGGALISGGVIGQALSLGPGEYVALDARKLVNSPAGTIEFWVRPHWAPDEYNSHTFISFSWADGLGGYFSVSKGWWEPTYSLQTFYIHNNEKSLDIYRQLLYANSESGNCQWTHFACVWNMAEPRFIRFYVNGFKVDELTAPLPNADYPVSGPLFLGTDMGCPAYSEGRYADSDFDEIASFNRALTDDEVLSIYDAQNPNPALYPPVGSNGFALETRAIFDEGTGWMTEQGAQETIRRIKAAGFNVYVPCVWHGAGTRYPSALAPAEPGLNLTGVDPLARLIGIAHQNGIKVHPWFTVTLREIGFYPEFFGPGTPPSAFDVQRPGFRKFIAGVIANVAGRYDVDGINLDYLRTMGFCSCSYCQKAYSETMGCSLSKNISEASAGDGLPPSLQLWVDQGVELLVEEISSQIKSIKPGLCLSVDAHPVPSPDAEGQQPVPWTNGGLIDLVFDMDYDDPPDFENHNLMRAQFNDPARFIELLANCVEGAGNAVYPVSTDVVSLWVDHARRRWGDGFGLYLYSMLSDAQISALGKKLHKAPAIPGNCCLGSAIPTRTDINLNTLH